MRLTVVWFLAFLVVFTACACDGGSPDPASDFSGSIVVLEGRGVLYDEGSLKAISRSAGTRAIAHDVDFFGLQRRAPEGRFLAFDDYRNGQDVIDVVNIDSGVIQSMGPGRDAVAGAAMVAFCTPDNDLVVADIDEPTNRKFITDVREACVRAAWSADKLAFIELGSSAGEDGVTASVWDGDIQTVVDVDVDVAGYGDMSWSPDERSILYSNIETLVEIDLSSGESKVVGPGERPQYSPTDATLYAVAEGPSIEIRDRAGAVVAELREEFPFDPQRATLAFSWSPDGERVALMTPSCIMIWNWRDGAVSGCIAEPEGSREFLPIVLWFP